MKKIFVVFIFVFALNKLSSAQQLKVMTYNMRLALASDKEDDWEHRKEMFAGMIGFYDPDFFGVQEALPQQVNYLETNLNKYKHIGIGRDGVNKGEASAIFYLASKFQLLQSNTFWLSETPGAISKGWDASYIRICTYGLFKDKKSGKKFWVFNTHLDNDGKVARAKGLELILKRMDSLNTSNLPVILTGDFNTAPNTDVITNLKTKMNDTKDICTSKPFGPAGTFNGFKYCEPVQDKIDYIFVSKIPAITVSKFAVLNNSINMHYPSDHFPVYAVIKIK
ncbi:MAG: endonuclease/exonuclease/phosphatase family protein [Bacteroidetes bacterium]|nr:endonuclease/exonuclease/phosphatase family protein [Bacteroidota bacterium]MBS1756075.1 endonuclease/exonuclease/phosphatase family protein [Bacteroidota bacterium]